MLFCHRTAVFVLAPALAVLFASCASAPVPAAIPGALPVPSPGSSSRSPGSPAPAREAGTPLAHVSKTVVVPDFEGGSITAPEESQFWCKALASLLIADLRASDALRVLDRNELSAVLREQRLSETALADPSSRQRVGRIVGASYFIFGTFTLLPDQAILVARVVDVETGEIVKSGPVVGGAAEMGLLSRKLSIFLLHGLDRRLAEQEEKRIATFGGPPIEAVRYFSEGLDREFRGEYDEAVDLFTRALAIQPDYSEAREHLEKASEAAARR